MRRRGGEAGMAAWRLRMVRRGGGHGRDGGEVVGDSAGGVAGTAICQWHGEEGGQGGSRSDLHAS